MALCSPECLLSRTGGQWGSTMCRGRSSYLTLSSGNVGKLLRGVERLNRRRRAGAFQAQAITSLLNQGQFQRLDEMNAGVAPSDFRLLQVRVGDLEGACRGAAVGHDFGDRTPLLGRGGGYGLGVEQHRLRAGVADAVGPGGEDAGPRHDATGEVGNDGDGSAPP